MAKKKVVVPIDTSPNTDLAVVCRRQEAGPPSVVTKVEGTCALCGKALWVACSTMEVLKRVTCKWKLACDVCQSDGKIPERWP